MWRERGVLQLSFSNLERENERERGVGPANLLFLTPGLLD